MLDCADGGAGVVLMMVLECAEDDGGDDAGAGGDELPGGRRECALSPGRLAHADRY